MQEMFLLRIALHFGTYNDFDFILLEIISLLHEFFFNILINGMLLYCISFLLLQYVEKTTCSN